MDWFHESDSRYDAPDADRRNREAAALVSHAAVLPVIDRRNRSGDYIAKNLRGEYHDFGTASKGSG